MVSVLPLPRIVLLHDVSLDELLFLITILTASIAAILVLLLALLLEQRLVLYAFVDHGHRLGLCPINGRLNRL